MFTARSGDGLEVGDMRRRLRELGQLCDDALLPQERLF
jgi:hypothetical protein